MQAWLFIRLLILFPCIVSGRLGNFDGLLPGIGSNARIPGQYILVFKREADPDAVLTRILSIADRQAEAASILFHYNVTMNGIAMKGLSKDTVRLLAQDHDIIDIAQVCIV